MRREEVAIAAGISVTWYTWLEQGRADGVSTRTLIAIANALRLDNTSRAYLLQLAAATKATEPSEQSEPTLTRTCSDELATIVTALAPNPAYVVNGFWDVLFANEPATAVLGDFFSQRGTTDNVLRRLFFDADWQRRFADWDAVAASAVAQYRAATATLVGDDHWRAAVDALVRESAAFDAIWTRHDLAPAIARRKIVRHPAAGELAFTYASFAPDGERDDLRVILYLPEDAATAAAVAKLRPMPHSP